MANHARRRAGDSYCHLDRYRFHEAVQYELQSDDAGRAGGPIGVVIDDAIVMVENIIVHLSLGQSSLRGGQERHQELTPALIGSTLTPIVVFVPLVFLGGVTAVFFRALAMTLVTALFASLFLAIFFTPVLARIFLKRKSESNSQTGSLEEAEQAGEGRILRALTRRYEAALHWALAHTR